MTKAKAEKLLVRNKISVNENIENSNSLQEFAQMFK